MNDLSQTLYQKGSLAIKQARYDDAIADLEQFCQETVHRQSKQFFQAQMWLVQAYHQQHQDLHAIALCEQLVKSEIPPVKQWADKALSKLMASPDPAPFASTPAPATSPVPSEDVPPSVESSEPAQLLDRQPADFVSTAQVYSAPRSTSPRPRTRRASSPAQKTVTKDFTSQILTALSHGSISFLASILLYLLFADSLIANGLGVIRFIVPLVIFFTTENQVVKENAREAVNYVITCLILIVPLVLATIFLGIIFVVAWPLAIAMGLVVGAYLLLLSVYPVIATCVCASDEKRVFYYPNWLILHLV